jgi:trehalose 6-phosphate phosphatase
MQAVMTADSVPVYGRPWALFLDVDGTLLDFADHPDGVVPRPATRSLLSRLSRLCDGALALVSGRAIDTIDGLFAPLCLPCAGLHGLERRRVDGGIVRQCVPAGRLAPFRQGLADFVAAHPGTLVEDKGTTVALHYRRRPAAEGEARERMAALLRQHGGDGELLLLAGKMVLEVRPAAADKGTAIEAYMAEAPFAGRRPVFLGDDVTDEHGFESVNALGGLTIKVGPGDTRARHRLDDIDAVMAWLDGYAQYLEAA